MKTTILVLSILFFGCVEPVEFLLDKNCSNEEELAAKVALDSLNGVLGYEHAIITGITPVDYEIASEVGGGHIIMCIPDEQTAALFDAEGDAGWYRAEDIGVRYDATTERYGVWAFQRVLMHELLHSIGALNSEHSDDPSDIFYSKFSPIESIEYTDSDEKVIRKYAIF